MPAVPPLDPPPAQAGGADPLAVALKAAAVQSAALVLLNAAQHVQRTTLLVEAATARVLARLPGDGMRDVDDAALAAARAALAEAMDLFAQAQLRSHTVAAERAPT